MRFTSVCTVDSRVNFRAAAIRTRCLVVVLLLGAALFYFVLDAGAQHQATQNGNLTLTIHPQIQLQEQGTDLVLKIRLAEGTSVKLWGSNSCGSPTDDSKTFIASGTYTTAVQNLSLQGAAYACAVSSDGFLKASLLLQN
jgi:hypothetical protein